MKQHTQLETLKRSSQPAGRSSKDRRTWLLMVGLLAGVALLFALIFGEQLRPRVIVKTMPVLLLEGGEDSAQQPEIIATTGAMVAQASGWIEPDPYPVTVPVKTDGFVETMHVLEGETVSAGDLLATLDNTNMTLEVNRLEAQLARAGAALEVATHQLTSASAAVARAEAMLKSSQARLDEARDRLARLDQLDASDTSPVERIAAERIVEEASANLVDAQTGLASARASLLAREADRNEKAAAAQTSAVMIEEARLSLERSRVYAPIDGVVLERYAAPGMKRMAGMDDMASSAIVSLYDPDRLQVRVDVPLADVGKIEQGGSARIMTAAFPNRVFTGRVSRITGEADITRNTLQVKVAIEQPDPRMRPEMLCRVEFMGTGQRAAGAQRGAANQSLWIPERALTSPVDAEGHSMVWVADIVTETAHPRDVRLAASARDGMREVMEGLLAGERVVVEGMEKLKPGSKVRMANEGDAP
jgi:HlyD family secretion protein